MTTTDGCCGPSLVVGWKRTLQPFMKATSSWAAPPPIPRCGPPGALQSTGATGECAVRLEPVSGICCACFSRCTSAAVLSAGELLCRSCAVDTFSGAEQRDAAARPRLALLARRGRDGRLLAADLQHDCGALARPLDARARELLGSLLVGDAVRCCGCIPSPDVGGQTGAFAGFCLRRRCALVRVGGSVACVRVHHLRRPADEAVAHHAAMLHALLRLGCRASTLRRALETVREAHTLCGTAALADAEAALVARGACGVELRDLCEACSDGELDDDEGSDSGWDSDGSMPW